MCVVSGFVFFMLHILLRCLISLLVALIVIITIPSALSYSYEYTLVLRMKTTVLREVTFFSVVYRLVVFVRFRAVS